MHPRSSLAAGAVAGLLFALPCAALLTRPDRDDDEYRELATRYPAAVSLGASVGAGALIAPRWILTSARAATALRQAHGAPSIAGRPLAVQEIIFHPDWLGTDEADLALLFLREAVAGVEPVTIHRDPDEAGQTARVVAFGESGRIGAAPSDRRHDGAARAAINTIDRVQPRTFAMRLKGPEDASDLQGALAAGDLGAPAFLENRGRISLGGVAASAGEWETYGRVSAYAMWIDEVMFRMAQQEVARDEAARRRRISP